MLTEKKFGDVVRLCMGKGDRPEDVFYWCCAYLIDDLLIDSGCPATAPELLRALRGRGVKRVACTHHHEDHIGANTLLARELGVEIYAPAASLDLIESGYEMKPYQEIVWEAPERHRPLALPAELVTANHRFVVVEAPGHSPDHVVLHEPDQGWLLVGDVFLTTEPRTCRADEDMAASLLTLKRLRSLEPRVMFNGLGAVIEGAGAALDQAIAFVEDVAAKVRAMQRRGLGPAEMVVELWGRESSLAQGTDGHMSYENMLRSLML